MPRCWRRANLLRVVGHDGDNFLGGRDFDWAIVDWAIGELNQQHGLRLAAPSRATAAVRKLKLAAGRGQDRAHPRRDRRLLVGEPERSSMRAARST